ncbi:phosphatase [Streptomyces griseocarneus]|nr:phosphatase [Streptomyces griseocarneus]
MHRTHAVLGGVYLLDPEESVLGLVVMCGLPVDASGPWRRLPVSGPGPTAAAMREQRLVWVPCQEEMARLYPRLAAYFPYELALASAPLGGARRCWGMVNLVWPPGHPALLSPHERECITSGARHIARVLDEADPPPGIPDLPRAVPMRRPGQEPTHSAPAAADSAERLSVGVLSLDTEGYVTFANTAAAGLLGRSAAQLKGTLPWRSLPWLDNEICADVYRIAVLTREPAVMTVLRPPDRWLDFRVHADDHGMSILVIPSGTGGNPSRPPAAARADVVSGGRIYQLMQQAAALAETVSVQDVIDLMRNQILPAFGAHAMVMFTAEGGRLRTIGYHGYDPEFIERLDALHMNADVTPAGHVMATGTPSFLTGPAELARAYPDVPQTGVSRAWAFLPLITSGRPIGCCVLAYRRPHEFTADERATLTPLAALIAQALDRARLYDAKHSLAHALQQALLPHALPTVSGLDVAARYLPAGYGMDVGGDFYDFIRLGDSAVAAVIGDVQGHDVTAAALMGQARTAVHSHATAGAAPDQVLARTDHDLADLGTDRFVSCLYAHFDLARHEVTLASAGHPPPLLRHSDGRARAVVIDPGPPLGIGVGASSYPLTTLTLTEGDLVVLYTDGLVEIPGTDIGRTTTDLARHLGESGDQPLHHLVDSLVQWTHRTHRTEQHADDIALLLLQTGSSATL